MAAGCNPGSGRNPAPVFAEVVPGLAYAQLVSTNEPWSIHIARLELGRREFRLATSLANQVVEDTATVPDQALATASDQARPVLAVNGDYFDLRPGPHYGDPRGVQIRDGELVSFATAPAFWVDAAGQPHIGEVSARARVTWPDGSTSPFELNGPVRSNVPSLFTPTFAARTRAINAMRLLLEPVGADAWPPVRANQTFAARVREIHPAGGTAITPGLLVLAADAAFCSQALRVHPGDRLSFATDLTPFLGTAPTALGGWPILVSPEKSLAWKTKPGKLDSRHPRTAIGFNDRYLFLVVVDGRQPSLSAGMTFVELASLMRRLGCTEALNLDGGGSSTFWLDGVVMNSPSDFFLRPVANALVVLREKP